MTEGPPPEHGSCVTLGVASHTGAAGGAARTKAGVPELLCCTLCSGPVPRSMFLVHGAQGPALRGSISPTPCLAGAVGNVERALCPLLLPETTAPGDIQPRSRWGPPCGQEMTRRGCGAAPFWTTVCCRVCPTSATCSGHFVCFQVSDNP